MGVLTTRPLADGRARRAKDKGCSLAEAELLQQDAGALDLLAAQRAEEARNQPVHQLEVRRQRRRGVVGGVEHLFAEALGVERGARAAVDEDETAGKRKALALLE